VVGKVVVLVLMVIMDKGGDVEQEIRELVLE
jgi:hypothetical protein